MDHGVYDCDKHIYEINYPNTGDNFLHVLIESPDFGQNTRVLARISDFYRRKLLRAEKYYARAAKRAAAKTEKEKKRGRVIIYPNDITVTYRIIENSESIISILREAAVNDIYGKKVLFFADNWDCAAGWMFSLDDVLYPEGISRKTVLKYAVNSYCRDTHTEKTKELARRFKKHFSGENIYYNGGILYLFYQPGEIADSDRGMISIPLDIEAIKALSGKQLRNSKTGCVSENEAVNESHAGSDFI